MSFAPNVRPVPATEKLARWHKLRENERLFIIHSALRMNHIKPEEVDNLLMAERKNTLLTRVAPFGLFPASYYLCKAAFPLYFGRMLNKHTAWARSGLVVLPLFLAWQYVSPFRTGLDREREDLLKSIDKKFEHNMMLWAEAVPRHYTEFEVLRQIRLLRNRRNGAFAGILYPHADVKPMVLGDTNFRMKPYGKDLF